MPKPILWISSHLIHSPTDGGMDVGEGSGVSVAVGALEHAKIRVVRSAHKTSIVFIVLIHLCSG